MRVTEMAGIRRPNRDFFRYSASILLAGVLLFTAISAIFYSIQIRHYRELVETSLNSQLTHQEHAILRAVRSIAADILYLSRISSFRDFIENGDHASRRRAARDFLEFAEHRGVYDQARFIDNAGMETIRINRSGGQPVIVPDTELQNKKDRYYFRDTLEGAKGRVFVSPLDLNVERGQVESPVKPVMRFGISICDEKGDERGIIMLNYLGNNFFDVLARRPRQVEHYSLLLLNKDGYFLRGLTRKDEWGFMYDNDITFFKRFPDAAHVVFSQKAGDHKNDRGIFLFRTIDPLAACESCIFSTTPATPSPALETPSCLWKLVFFLPSERLAAKQSALFRQIATFHGPFTVLWLLTSLYIAHLLVKRKASAEALRQYAEELRSLNASKDKFFSIIAHDLKNPFISLVATTDTLADEVDRLPKEEAREFLHDVRDSARKIFHLLQNLLKWSSMHTGRMAYSPVDVSLSELVDASIDLLSGNAKNKRVRLDWQPDREIGVCVDRDMIACVTQNLIANAIKFTPSDGCVTVAVRQLQTEAEVCVSDTGVGMTEEVAQQVFRVDARHSTPGTAGEQGTGLGLVLCKEMVERNGGRIWLESTMGAGTAFRFTLPLSK